MFKAFLNRFLINILIMKTIVYYYSRKGSNRYLANKISNDLNCDIEEIKPRLNFFILMLLGINFGNTKLKNKVENYDKVILCGPIWMGKLIIPLKNFINNNLKIINKLIFVTCCGSSFKDKDNKFGHNLVFKIIKNITGDKCVHCEAFPIGLVLTEEQKKEQDSYMKYQLNDENFKGEIVDIYNSFVAKIKEI